MAKGRSSPIADWMNQHKVEVERSAGKSIAVHPNLGIVASSEDHNEVVKAVAAKGLQGKAVIYRVPGTREQRQSHQEHQERLRAAVANVLEEAEKLLATTPNLPSSFVEAVEAWKKTIAS